MQVDDPSSNSEIVDPAKSAEVFQNGMDIIYVYPDEMNLKGNDEKPRPVDAKSEIVHSMEEPPVLTQNSNHSVTNHRNMLCNNDARDCSAEVEIYKLWLDF